MTVTDGGGSVRAGKYADHTDDEIIEVRRLEQRKAALVGEYACQVQLMYPSSDIKKPDNEGVIADLRAVLETARPQVVYLHNPADRHDTHVAAFCRALSALRALPPGRRPAKVYGCEVWRDLDWLHEPDRVVLPADDHPDIAASLAGVFDSQISSGKRFDKAVAGRRSAHATFLESHALDQVSAVSFAMDLTPLIADDGVTAADFTLGLIRNFETEVRDRIGDCS